MARMNWCREILAIQKEAVGREGAEGAALAQVVDNNLGPPDRQARVVVDVVPEVAAECLPGAVD